MDRQYMLVNSKNKVQTFEIAKDIKKYESRLFILTDDFFSYDSYTKKEEKDLI